MAGHLCFPIQHLPPLIEYFIETFMTLCSFEAEAFIGQPQTWWFFPPQYKHKSSLSCWSFSFYNCSLNLEESICFGSGIDALVSTCFHGLIASALYDPCVECRSYWHSNNWLSHHTACASVFVNVNGLCKFKNKSLISSRNSH